MHGATGLKFHNAIADPKVAEKHIYTKLCICNSFQVIGDFTHYGMY